MWKYNGKSIRPGKSWRDDNRVLHPGNWNIWSAEYKASMDIIEIIPETPPDSRLYTWSMNKDGTINSKAKELDDSGEVLGLKSNLKNEVKRQQGTLLDQTDWVIIRKADTGKEVPTNIKTWRDAIRVKATEMENAIDAASSVDDIVKLWVTHKVDEEEKTIKSGILYDWPELES
jgi:hypothetical protein